MALFFSSSQHRHKKTWRRLRAVRGRRQRCPLLEQLEGRLLLSITTASELQQPSPDLMVENLTVDVSTSVDVGGAVEAIVSANSSANLALGGTASQSSTYPSPAGPAHLAIDGNTNGNYFQGSVTATNNHLNSYWQVDLGLIADLERIVLFNRSDCCGVRLSNFRVSVLDAAGQTVFAQDYFTPAQGGGSVAQGGTLTINLPPGTQGRTVRVQLLGWNNEGNGYLSLAEVQVFGTPTSGVTNLALTGTATQSSTRVGGGGNDARFAIDGNTNGVFFDGSVTHTNSEPNSFWQVDLGLTADLERIVLFNRADCCGIRLSNFRVSVLDAAGQTVFAQDYFTPGQGGGSVALGGTLAINLPQGTQGRTVRVQLLGFNNEGNGILSLAEVQVFGTPAVDSDLPALPVTQGLIGHFRADYGVTHSNGMVDRWEDLSPAGQAVAATGNSRPTLVTANNGLSALRFDGNDRLTGSLGTTLAGATIFALFQYTVDSSDNDYLYTIGAAGASGSQMSLSRRAGERAYHFDGALENFPAGTQITAHQFHYTAQVYGDGAANSHKLYFNGGVMPILSTTANNPYNANGSTFVIGDWTANAHHFVGELAELIVFDRVLPDAERHSVEAYLEARLRGPASAKEILLNELIGPSGTNADALDAPGHVVNLVGTALNGGPTLLAAGAGSLPAFDFNTFEGIDRTTGFQRSDLLAVRADQKHDGSPLLLDLNGNQDFADETPQPGFGMHANRFVTFDLEVLRANADLPADQAFVLTGFSGPANAAPTSGMALAILLDGVPLVMHDVPAGSRAALPFTELVDGQGRYLTFVALEGAGLNPNFAHGGFAQVKLTTASAALVANVRWDTANRGDLAAEGGWQERIVITNLTTGAVPANAQLAVAGNLAAGETVANQYSFHPTQPGRYRVSVTTDSGDKFFESNADGHDAAEANNTAEAEFLIPGADLVVSSLAVSPELLIGNPAQAEITWTVMNQGPAAPNVSQWIDRVVFSADQVIGNADDVVLATFTHLGGLAPDASYARTQTVTLPANRTGQFHLFVATDAANAVIEPDGEGNNASQPQAIHVTVPYADLVVEAVSAPASAPSGDSTAISWRIRNQGVSQTNASSWVDRIVLSSDDLLDAGDIELARVTRNGALPAGSSYTATRTLDLPRGIEGNYHIFVVADADGQVFEFTLDDNNTGRTIHPILVTRVPEPDLIVSAVSSAAAAQPGQLIPVSFTVQNIGEGDAAASWIDRVYLSSDGALAGATLLATEPRGADLPGHGGSGSGVGGSYDVTVFVTVPSVVDGDYRIIVVTDHANDVYEGATGSPGESNNVHVSDHVLAITHPNLVPSIVAAPGSATSGDTLTVTFDITNAGSGAADRPWTDRVYLSTDTVFDAGDLLLAEVHRTSPLPSGAALSSSVDVSIPASVSGPRFILVVADAGQTLDEVGDEGDNIASTALQVDLAPFADLEVSNVRAPALNVGDPLTITVDWTLSNVGTGPGFVDTWIERIIASTDNVLGNGDDRLLAQVTHHGLIPNGDSVERSQTFTLPPAFQGRYVLFVQTDATNAVFENGNESNNAARLAGTFDVVTIPYADLVVDSVTTDPAGGSGQPFTVSWRVRNDGANAIGQTSTSSWNDTVQIVTNPNGSGVIATYTFNHVGALAVDGYYDRSASVTLPNGISGPFYARVATGGPFEFLHTNNNARVSDLFHVTFTPAPDLTVSHIAAPSLPVTSGDAIDVAWTVENLGPGAAAGSWTDRVRLVGTSGGAPVVNLGTFTYTAEPGGLPAGGTYTRQERFTLPINTSGVFRVEVLTNANNALFEPSRSNNTVLDDQTVQIELRARPDLQVQQIVAPATASAGGTASLQFTVINQSTAATSTPLWNDRVYLSLDNQISGDDVVVGAYRNGAALGPGEQYVTTTPSFDIPRRFRGPAFLIVRTDDGNAVDEFPNENNNTRAVQLDIDPLPPSDLVLSNVVAPTQVFDGARIQVSYRVSNLGAGETDRDSWTETIWLTTDRQRPSPGAPGSGASAPIPGDILLGTFTHHGSLAVGQFADVTRTVTLPRNVSGQFFITPWTDSTDVVLEDTFDANINPDDPTELDNNNYKARPITILLTPPPDLTVTDVSPQPSGRAGAPFTVSWTVSNIGQGVTQETGWTDAVYLSQTPDGSGGRLLLGHVTRNGALEVDDSYTATATFHLSPAAAGKYVIVEAGAGVFEGSLKQNNTRVAATDVTNAPADFVVSLVTADAPGLSGERINVSYTVLNQGADVWSGTQYWTDRVYVSPDAEFIAHRATLLGSVTHSNAGGLVNGASYTESAPFTLPRGIGGDYYIHVFANVSGTQALATGNNDFSRESFRSRAFETPGNNAGRAPLPVIYREPDLVVSDLTLPATPPIAGQTITVAWTVTNTGTRATREASWFDRVYLSKDPSLDSGDQLLGSATRSGSLGIGDSYTQALNVALPDGRDGDFYLLIFTDSNIAGPTPPGGPGVGFEQFISPISARVPEFQHEGNNITAEPLTIDPAAPPDLRVTRVTIPERIDAGQEFTIRWEVTNVGAGPTSDKTPRWDDLVYFSADQLLDLAADRFLLTHQHTGVLHPGESYTVNQTLRAPANVLGPFYVIVVTDPARSNQPRGRVFEGTAETNNARASDAPLLIELPPPADLQVISVTIPPQAKVGQPVTIEWTVQNTGVNLAAGRWSDALYLSQDAVWDIHDPFIGRVQFHAPPQGLLPGQSYTQTFTGTLPPAKPGAYRVLVRTDLFNEVYEDVGEANNRTPSAETVNLTVDALQMGVPLNTTLSTGQSRLFEVSVGAGETLVVSVSGDAGAANEIFARFDDVPTAIVFDAAYEGPLAPNQFAVVSATQPGKYYVLVRGHSQPAPDTPVTVLARVLPFGIIDVAPDVGGDSKYVTTTILGAQFKPGAVVRLVRPGIHEVQPASYQVVDSTKIVAIFDLTDAPRGLYDVAVTNPNGDTATIPYRYLVERALEPEVTVGLGGPRVLAPGQTGYYGVSVLSRTNIDTPYTRFTFGAPELGENDQVFGLPYVVFASNLRGAPEGPNDGSLADVPFATLVPHVNTPREMSGETLAPGYVFDLATRGAALRSFSLQTYPGLPEILEADPKALEGIEDEDIAFQFHIVASATSLTRDEFIAQQSAEARALRAGILNDAAAPLALKVLAADAVGWVALYLAALEDAGLLRPEEQAPPVREAPLVVSLMAALATGILAGPGGESILAGPGSIIDPSDPATQPISLLDFFAKLRQWYDHDPELLGTNAPPPFADFDLGTSRRTHFEAFEVFVPYGKARLDLPTVAPVTPVSFSSFLEGDAGGVGNLATLVGPFGYGDQQFVPVGQPLPYTVYFENASTAGETVGEVRIVTELDANLDPRRFRLGDLRVGNIEVNLPKGRGAFAGEFDFSTQLGFILRINAGLDIPTNTATWLIQAIDPTTGEVVTNPQIGLLPPNDANGAGAGFVTYTTAPLSTAVTSDVIEAQARVLFNTAPPEDTQLVTHVIDAAAPTTTLTVTPLGADGASFLIEWTAVDDDAGSGVRHVTVYAAQNGGDFRIVQLRSTDTSFVFEGEAGNTYEFLALATDNAGNREQPPFGIAPPDDGSRPNLGALPEVLATTELDLGQPPDPTPDPSSNQLFLEAQVRVPQTPATTRPSEFETVLRPFVAQSFATGIGQSFSGIGPLALVAFDDGSLLASGGLTRGSLFRLPMEGGAVGEPLATLPYPVFDMALAPDGTLWAATGGGPLLQLDPNNGHIIHAFGEGLTQTLAIEPQSGLVYVSSGRGIEIFDPVSQTFQHFTDTRVGNMRFAPDGTLWAATWPTRGQIVRFTPRGLPGQTGLDDEPQLMLRLDSPVDSLAFGLPGTPLEGLLWISSNSRRDGSGTGSVLGGELVLVDLATLQQVTVATNGSRGDIVVTTADGRVLLSQSNQIDVISPRVAPRAIGTNPPDGSVVGPPLAGIDILFDEDLFTGPADNPASALHPDNYAITDAQGDPVRITSVTYDQTTRTVSLAFDALQAEVYTLIVSDKITSSAGIPLAIPFESEWTVIVDLTAFVDIAFQNTRLSRGAEALSYDVTITNIGGFDLLIPATLLFAPGPGYGGAPVGGIPDGGGFLIDLSGSLGADGVLAAGESLDAFTVAVQNLVSQRLLARHGLFALPANNAKPAFVSHPITNATAGEPYQYAPVVVDPDETAPFLWLLIDGPAGMLLDSISGELTWAPTTADPARSRVTLRVYDTRGAFDTQIYDLTLAGGNHAPVIVGLAQEHALNEGDTLTLTLAATDADGDKLYWSLHGLPAEASFDPLTDRLTWTPGPTAAGTYPLRVTVTDGRLADQQTILLLVAPTPAPPTLTAPAFLTRNEGDTIQIQLIAVDPEGEPLTFSSNNLPGGATLHPTTGLFQWTPQFFQAGVYDISFQVSDGTFTTTCTTTITVLNVNAPPQFDPLGIVDLQEGQLLHLRPFAYDPDNRFYIPPERLPDGSLTPLEGSGSTVSYTVHGLPPGATFDFETVTFAWRPDYTQAGEYQVTFTATDDGDGTGVNAQSSATLTLRVANTNRPPVLDPIGNVTVSRGEILEIPVTATDADGNPIALFAVNALTGFTLPDFVTFTDHGGGVGLLRVAPGFGDRGNLVLTIRAMDDGDIAGGGTPGSSCLDEITFVISVESLNEPPVLAHVGDTVALVGQMLTFQLHVTDPDPESLTFEMLNAPGGATLTPSVTNDRLATFTWSPAAGDLAGSPYSITFRVTDSGNGLPSESFHDERTIRIVVRATNAAPILLPVGNQTATEQDTLTVALAAVDSDGDALTYSVVNAPPGATLDPVTGVFKYTPNLLAAADYGPVTFTVSDGLGTSSESITIHVTNLNQPPVLVPLPTQSAREQAEVQFTLTASDIDGDPLTYFVVGSLPAGATFNVGTGAFHWTPSFDQAGVYDITFGVRDVAGLEDQSTVRIRVDNVNRPPTLAAHDHQVATGQTLAFTLLGDDPDAGTTLSYAALGLPPGAELDTVTGNFVWTPTADQAGDYIVAFTVSDGELTTKRGVLIRAAATPAAPAVSVLLTPSFPALPGQPVVLNVLAESVAPIAARALTVGGQPVPLDALQRAVFTPPAPGVYPIEVTATDANGLVGTATAHLRVRDPADAVAPVVSLATAQAGIVSQATGIIATVQDTNFDFWVLERTRLNDDAWKTVASGVTPLDAMAIATIDPNELANGLYSYRLTAKDIAARTSRAELVVEINSAVKTNHVTLAETDLVMDLGGQALLLTRFYDSLNRHRTGRFGFGWSLLGVDFDVQAGVPSTGREHAGVFPPFRDGTRVYLTLPDGQRAGYTFAPIEHRSGNLTWFTPAFASDAGQSSMLTSVDATLMRVGDRYYDLRSGHPYHPASGQFAGPDYTLMLADGTVYRIDSQRGGTEFVTAGGQQAFLGDQGVVTSAGTFVSFGTDEAKRVGDLVDDHGAHIRYTYDEIGNLVTARQQPAGPTTTYLYDAADPHLLVDKSVSSPTATAPNFFSPLSMTASSAPPLPAGIPYYLDVIAKTGDQNLIGFGDQPSINDSGTVAFVGQFTDGEGIFTGDTNSLKNINPTFSHTLDRVFGRSVQINNLGQVLARDRVSGSPPLTYVRIWDGDEFEIQATGGVRVSSLFPNIFEDYAGVVSHGALNNQGQGVFGALTFDDFPDPFQFLSTLSGTFPTRRFHEFELRVGARPMMADTGEIVVQDDDGRIILLPYDLSTLEVIADNSQFSELGRAPSISDDGRVIAFYGVLNAAGAAAQNYPQGPGIFASLKTSSGRVLTRITGTQFDGVLDPGEAWNDANSNGVVDPGEDFGGLVSFDHNLRIGVTAEFANNRGNLTTAFVATSAAGERGVYTTGLSYDFTTFEFTPVQLSTVVKVGQNVPNVGTITDVGINDPINNKGQVAVWVQAGSTQAILRASEAHRPVLIVPGIGGTFPADGTSWIAWIVERGRHPDTLQLDTLSNAYDDLVTSFENLGYVQGKNLFGAVYDWRLDVGPEDGTFDGHIHGLTASGISDETFEYGVDYLGYFLKKAAEQWALDFPDEPPLDSVDMIVHSTGGLVARTYIQSDAYNGDAGGVTLPAVNNLFMVGVPNRGAAKAWNPIHNDWNVEPTFSYVLSKILYHAYRKVRNAALLDALTGENTVGISGPDYNIRTADIFGTNFTQQDVFNDKADFERFIDLYNPTGRSLLATYPFLMTPGGTVTVNNSPEDRNNYMLDLNNGLDLTTNLSDLTVNDWVEKIGRAFVLYGSDGETPVFAEQHVGPPMGLFVDDDVLLPFTDFIASAPDDGQIWWEDIFVANGGDGTVPLASSRAQFQSDGRFTLFNATAAETGGPTGHVELTRNIGVQRLIFDTLGLRHTDTDISTELGATPNVGNVLSALIDPVEAIIVDGQGRRVGFSSAAGVLTEIPGGNYLGDTDGFVLITGPAVNEPFTLELTGLGGDYYIQIGISTDTHIGGVEADGFLAKGQKRSIEVPVWERTNDRPTATNDSATTDEDTTVMIDVLGNDGDEDGTLDPTTLQIVNAPINGSATVTSGGMIAYAPSRDFHGTDFFTYTVRDDGGAVASKAVVTVEVLPVNDAPVANNDTANAREGGEPIVIAVLANDTDVDDQIDPATVRVESGPQHGSIQIDPVSGEITYTPGATFLGNGLGSDTFTYSVADMTGDRSLPATVFIHINRRPVARDDNAATDEDTPVTIDVLANDHDVDGVILARTVALAAAPSHGTARVNRNGTITYTPQPNFHGTDSFQYTVRDDTNGVSLPATVTVEVADVNDAPRARDDIAFALAGVPIQIDILANDTDVDGTIDPSTVAIMSPPAHGSVMIGADGVITYTPAADFTEDSFTYTVRDDRGEYSNAARVTVALHPPESIRNGAFHIADSAATGFGWSIFGDVRIVNGQAVLGASSSLIARLTQSFTVPNDARALRFTIEQASLNAAPGTPVDAFEVALFDATTATPVAGVVGTLGATDALLNLQPDGTLHVASAVSVSNASATAAGPMQVEVDLTGLAGRVLTLYFDLPGFGAADSSVVVDNVRLIGADGPPLELRLDPASDSAAAGDGLTNITPMTLIGTTLPDRQVLLDTDGDGFDDGSTLADEDGQFRFVGVLPEEGINVFRVRVSSNEGVTEAELVVTLDTQPPAGTLATPVASSAIAHDPGYVEIQWLDTGAAGLDANTFGIEDITITGVNIESITDLGSGRVRYTYGGSPSLPEGIIQVQLIAGAVADLAGNPSAAAGFSFGIDRLGPVGILVDPAPASTIGTDTGYVEVQWLDLGLAGLDPTSFSTNAVTVTGVSVDRVQVQSGGVVRYWYNDDGDLLPIGKIEVALQAGAVRDLAGNASAAAEASFTLATSQPMDVTGLVKVSYYGVQYNRRTGVWAFYGQVTNQSNQPLSAPIRVLWAGLAPAGSMAMNADGMLEDGTPYFELDAGDGVLEPGETSAARTFAVKTPSSTQYAFTTIVTAVLPPSFSALPQSVFTSTAAPTVYPFHNYDNPHDVNGNGQLEPLDVLIVLNHLNTYGPGPLVVPDEPPQVFPDVNADGEVTPLDALILVNALNAALSAEGEGDFALNAGNAATRRTGLSTPAPQLADRTSSSASLSFAPAADPSSVQKRPATAGFVSSEFAYEKAADSLRDTPSHDAALLESLFGSRADDETSRTGDHDFIDVLTGGLEEASRQDQDELLDDLARDVARAAQAATEI